jgi:hypothetical protein
MINGHIRTSHEVDKPHSSANKLPAKLEVLLSVLNCCEVFHGNPALGRLYLLAVKHLQYLFKIFEGELRTIALNENARNILHGVSKKTAELAASASLDRVPVDPYFTHMFTQISPDSQAFVEYLQFWLKSSISALAETLKKQQLNPSERPLLPQTFNCYVHAGHYYLLVDSLRRKCELASDTPFLRLARDSTGPTNQNLHHLSELTQTLIV